jgi:hypothetical protein
MFRNAYVVVHRGDHSLLLTPRFSDPGTSDEILKQDPNKILMSTIYLRIYINTPKIDLFLKVVHCTETNILEVFI